MDVIALLPPGISIHALREEGDRLLISASRSSNDFYPRPPRGGRPLPQINFCSRTLFLSTPSARRATYFFFVPNRLLWISIHALREEGDSAGACIRSHLQHFYPRPPRGGRLQHSRPHRSSLKFLSTPSARRATDHKFKHCNSDCISIHALRKEGDGFSAVPVTLTCDFYPRPPQGGRPRRSKYTGWRPRFLSTPSARRATPQLCLFVKRFFISIHALRKEGDLEFGQVLRCFGISIHALRKEGDNYALPPCLLVRYFYPRPPQGGRRSCSSTAVPDLTISIHALRKEGDPKPRIEAARKTVFLSTPSARRATALPAALRNHLVISIHALRKEGDPCLL